MKANNIKYLNITIECYEVLKFIKKLLKKIKYNPRNILYICNLSKLSIYFFKF